MHWNISRVAKKLDLSRNTLYRRMKRFGINPPR
ncbi:MAG: helix-turn-helix domain-containing protein [Candidatus Thiodiazotropha sp.]